MATCPASCVGCCPAVPGLSSGLRLLCCGELGNYQDNSVPILGHPDMKAAGGDQKAKKDLRKFLIYREGRFYGFYFCLKPAPSVLPSHSSTLLAWAVRSADARGQSQTEQLGSLTSWSLQFLEVRPAERRSVNERPLNKFSSWSLMPPSAIMHCLFLMGSNTLVFFSKRSSQKSLCAPPEPGLSIYLLWGR